MKVEQRSRRNTEQEGDWDKVGDSSQLESKPTKKAVGSARKDNNHRPQTVLLAPPPTPPPPSLPRNLRLRSPPRGFAEEGVARRTKIGSAALAEWSERASTSHVRKGRREIDPPPCWQSALTCSNLCLSPWKAPSGWRHRRTGSLRTRSLQRELWSWCEERAPISHLPQCVVSKGSATNGTKPEDLTRTHSGKRRLLGPDFQDQLVGRVIRTAWTLWPYANVYATIGRILVEIVVTFGSQTYANFGVPKRRQ